MSLDLLGLRIQLATDESFREQLASLFELEGANSSQADGVRPELLIRTDVERSGPPPGTRRVRTVPPDAPEFRATSRWSAPQLASAITRWAATNTSRHIVFHAAAVSREGRAILLPGGSRTGKSTLTAGLVRRGFHLISDEVGAIDRQSGKLVPYPRTMWLEPDVLGTLRLASLKARSGDRDTPRFVRARDLQGKRTTEPAEVVLIVFPLFVRNAETVLERIGPGTALHALVDSSCAQRLHGVERLDVIIDLGRRVTCYHLTFGELESALDEVEDAYRRVGRTQPKS